MMLGARTAAWAKRGGGVPTAKDYVQDGLVAMWDGIENAGWGVHDPNATVSRDLVGNVVSLGTCLFGDNFFTPSLGASFDLRTSENVSLANGYTIKICANLLSVGDGDPTSIVGFIGKWSTEGETSIKHSSSYGYALRVKNTICEFDPILGKGPFGINASFDGRNLCQYSFLKDKQFIQTLSGSTDGKVGVVTISLLSTIHGLDNLFEVYNVAVYRRGLSMEELSHNCAVDKARFGLT